MKAHTDGSGRRQDGWRPWLRVAAAAAFLLALSEVLWLWQTWPVRALLQPPAAATGGP
jgi:hypothetical protein